MSPWVVLLVLLVWLLVGILWSVCLGACVRVADERRPSPDEDEQP